LPLQINQIAPSPKDIRRKLQMAAPAERVLKPKSSAGVASRPRTRPTRRLASLPPL